jgi:hypothetical protein
LVAAGLPVVRIPITKATGKLRVESRTIDPGETSALAPFIDQGESLISGFIISQSAETADIAHAQSLPPPVVGRLVISRETSITWISN